MWESPGAPPAAMPCRGHGHRIYGLPMFGMWSDVSNRGRSAEVLRQSRTFCNSKLSLDYSSCERLSCRAGRRSRQGPGQILEYIDFLFKNQSALDDESLKKYATCWAWIESVSTPSSHRKVMCLSFAATPPTARSRRRDDSDLLYQWAAAH